MQSMTACGDGCGARRFASLFFLSWSLSWSLPLSPPSRPLLSSATRHTDASCYVYRRPDEAARPGFLRSLFRRASPISRMGKSPENPPRTGSPCWLSKFDGTGAGHKGAGRTVLLGSNLECFLSGSW